MVRREAVDRHRQSMGFQRNYARAHTHTHTQTHTHRHTHRHTHIHIHTHTYTHTDIHTDIHIHTQTYTHTHIHTRGTKHSDTSNKIMFFFSHGWTAHVGLGLLCEVPRSHSDTSHSVELLCMNDKPVA